MEAPRKKKHRKRSRKESSSSSSDSSSSQGDRQRDVYQSDLNAFLHSVGVLGTSHRDSTPPPRDESPPEKKDVPAKREEGRVRTAKVIETATNKHTIPLPASSAHMPKRGNPMSGPEPPSSAK